MNYNNSNLKKMLNIPIKNVIDEIVKTVQLISPNKNSFYRRNVKYTTEDYAVGIIDVLRTSISWNRYSGLINGNTLRKKHNEWCNLNIYEHVYEKFFNKYINTVSFTEELKYQSIDSTHIDDINGSKSSSYSGIYKRRKGEASKGVKVTSLVTTNGIPISINISPANKYDSPILPEIVNNIIIDCKTKEYTNNNRYKQYILADSGYDSKNNMNVLTKKGYTPIIIQNRRNIKKRKLIRTYSKKSMEIYKKRIKVENYHSWIKKFPKIKSLYEKNINYYKGLLLIGVSIIISRRIKIK